MPSRSELGATQEGEGTAALKLEQLARREVIGSDTAREYNERRRYTNGQ
jgi:hypothetical protein